jgi:murein DD-endopeptidase MepM/ murein hydrolase activator NlpD
VKRGQVIGLVGSSGRSTGAHLHYELSLNGKAINPATFMETAGLSKNVITKINAAAVKIKKKFSSAASSIN